MRTKQVPVKHPYIGGTRWAFMKWADIPDARDESLVYLRRLRIVQTPWFAIYLHFIYNSDEDRDPHDHPFFFNSFVVRGGYIERLFTNPRRGLDKFVTQRHARWSMHSMPLQSAHIITDLEPDTTTLVFCGPKTKDWGFWTPEGFVPWQEYNRQKYDEPF